MRRLLAILFFLLPVACASQRPFHHEKAKQLEFTIVQNYDKGSDLTVVADDFAAIRDLGVHTWRGRFGWSDYEPQEGTYDFEWLEKFVGVARDNGIALRPYIALTPEWAGRPGSDGKGWNDPPANPGPWREFVTRLATTLAPYHDVLSYEIYYGENSPLLWEGNVEDYTPVLAAASEAVRGVDPSVSVVMGGLVSPDIEWIEKGCADDPASFDAVAIHAYPETSITPAADIENFLGPDYAKFADAATRDCGEKKLWIAEAGFPDTDEKSEREQANSWVRAIATFAASPDVTQIGIRALKDLPEENELTAGEANRDLGILRSDGTRKLAYKTLKMLIPMLSEQKVTPDYAIARIGRTLVYRQTFTREDGRRILFVWNRSGVPYTVNVKLDRPMDKAVEYFLDGRSEPYRNVGKKVLHAVKLGNDVRIFEIQ